MKKLLLSIYPFLFALYPILALIAYNIVYIDPGAVVRSAVVAVMLAGILWIIFRVVTHEWDRSGIVTVLALVLFFFYGHVYLQLEKSLGLTLRHRYLAAVFVVVFIVGAWWIITRIKDVVTWQNTLIVITCVLLVFPSYQLASFEISNYQPASTPAPATNLKAQTGDLPDIYWILLDAHTRSDILLKYYNYDNSKLIKGLEDLGFYVAKCSQSNYPATQLSVSSLMYGQYLDQIPGYENGLPPLKRGMVSEVVRSLGYTVIAFENRSNGHFNLGEDMRLSRNQMALGRIDLFGGLNEFEFTLMQTSALRLIYDMPQLVPGLDPKVLTQSEYYEHYHQVMFILDTLPNMPKTKAPKFVFTHILVPHPPYIFSPDGNFQATRNAIEGYRNNVEFIDNRILKVVTQIVKNSKTPPIIVIQGDHGPTGPQVTPQMRMAILNAYYVNDQTKKDLYPTITPINTFRIIFNSYFGTNFPLLTDTSYYAYGKPHPPVESEIVPNNYCTNQ